MSHLSQIVAPLDLLLLVFLIFKQALLQAIVYHGARREPFSETQGRLFAGTCNRDFGPQSRRSGTEFRVGDFIAANIIGA